MHFRERNLHVCAFHGDIFFLMVSTALLARRVTSGRAAAPVCTLGIASITRRATSIRSSSSFNFVRNSTSLIRFSATLVLHGVLWASLELSAAWLPFTNIVQVCSRNGERPGHEHVLLLSRRWLLCPRERFLRQFLILQAHTLSESPGSPLIQSNLLVLPRVFKPFQSHTPGPHHCAVCQTDHELV